MKRSASVLSLFLLSTVACTVGGAAPLFTNGPVITSPTGGTSSILGLPISRTETGTGLGRTSRSFRGEAIADNFTVPGSKQRLSSHACNLIVMSSGPTSVASRCTIAAMMTFPSHVR